MNDYNDRLISLLTCAIREDTDQKVLLSSMSDEEIKVLYNLSQKHDLTHLVAVALNKVDAEEKKRYKLFFQGAIKAMYRYEWLKGEQEKIYTLLEQHNIPYIPLKGAVIRELYREPWHRTSCDIDVLVPEERVDEAASAFCKELSYTRGKRSRHDVSMTAPNGVHFELHFDIDEVYVDCAEFWADAKPITSDGYRHTLSAEMLMLTHIAHMAKHFANGGCGLRPFIDLWLMRKKLPYDKKKLTQMVDEHGLTEFSKAVSGLVDVWFNEKAPNETETMMKDFILPAGVYGNLDNKISINRSKGKSMFVYAVERIFPPRSSLKIAYPILSRYPQLLAVCWVRRWIRLIRAGKLKQVRTEYNINRRLDVSDLNNTEELLKRLELRT